ncbi:phospholipase A [Spirosoma sp. SC4-14]|uniref:phospholipase A n=1 Tax=Spirosoma sp. SC4-14 TaxID=3128900 RepID=UPI0030D3377A
MNPLYRQLWLLILVCLAPVNSRGQMLIPGQPLITPDSTARLNERIGKEPYFTIFRDNYFLVGTALNERPRSTNSDAKFQISFRIRTASLPWLLNTHLYLMYTQRSFWDIFRPSLPFRETNYNPGLGIGRFFYINHRAIHAIFCQVEHESNGRDSVMSRSWNRVSFIYLAKTPRLTMGLKVWVPFGQEPVGDDKELLTRYYGYGEISGYYRLFPNQYFILDWTVRKGTHNWKGQVQTGLRWKPRADWNQYLYLQFFGGYGESLLEVQQRVFKARLGVVFSPGSPVPL